MAQRRSALAGKSAVAAPTAPQEEKAPEEAQNASQEPLTSPATTEDPTDASKGAQQPTEPPKGKKKKVSFYQHREEEDRARAAWMHTMGHTGHTTITSFMEAAVANYTRQLEADYNDAKPFN